MREGRKERGRGKERKEGWEGRVSQGRGGEEREEEKREKMFPDSFVCFDFCYVLWFWFLVVFIRENKNIKLAVEDLGERKDMIKGYL